MTAAAAPERSFPVNTRGQIRDRILVNFRVGLRLLPSPDTGLPFTEREIQIATSDLTRWYAEADAIDIVLVEEQRRAIFLADQARPARATASWLINHHGDLWGEGLRPASGGSGPASAAATVGEVFQGSTTLPDAAAAQCTDPLGNLYQVLFDATTGAGGTAALQLAAVATGSATNLESGTTMKWAANAPLGAAEEFDTTDDFTGGAAAEDAATFAARLLDRIRRKPAAGNSAHMRTWAKDSTSSVEEGFVFPCALYAGTVLVCVTQRRGSVTGGAGRIASVGTLALAIAYLTPPGSPVVPVPPLVLLVAAQQSHVDMAVQADMPVGRDAGWADAVPWPTGGDTGVGDAFTEVTLVTDQTHFQITRGASSADLPASGTPQLMIWDDNLGRLEELSVLSVILSAGNVFDVVLNSAPTATVAVNQLVSPFSKLAPTIGATVEEYFDSLGPGEVIDLSADERGHRAFRQPPPSEVFPARAGSGVLVFLEDAIGSVIADATLEQINVNSPPLPADPTDGPFLNVARHFSIYPPT